MHPLTPLGKLTVSVWRQSLLIKHDTAQAVSSCAQAAPLLDNIVFSAIKKGFGGRLRFVVSGGAPLGSSVQEYLQIVLCCPILQGYGLTETCAALSSSLVHSLNDFLRNSLLEMLSLIEVRRAAVAKWQVYVSSIRCVFKPRRNVWP